MKTNSKKYDVVILTEKKYVNPKVNDDYVANLLLEDQLVADSLVNKGLRVVRTNWDNPEFDWSSSKYLIIRSTWDYSERIDEFLGWMERVSQVCQLINPVELVRWNIDKNYLRDIAKRGVPIVPTYFVSKGETISLSSILLKKGWQHVVIKPVISCAGRETHKVLFSDLDKYEPIFAQLVKQESMMVQPFIESIETKGEISMMVFGGKYSHSVLKKAKPGDFRVQDDFGGTVHEYDASESEIAFAESVVKYCNPLPLYARVDAVWDNTGELCVSELELIEPELWFRNRPEAAEELAKLVVDGFS